MWQSVAGHDLAPFAACRSRLAHKLIHSNGGLLDSLPGRARVMRVERKGARDGGDAIIAAPCGPTGRDKPLNPSARNPLLSIIQAAGWPIWPLILCSIVGLALVVERFMTLREQRIAPPRLLDEVIAVTRQGLPSPDVVAKLHDNSVLGEVLASGLRAIAGDPRLNEAGLRQVFENAGRIGVHQLERYLNTLGTIAAAAPLLGLFGTVIGMIEIFGSQSPTGTNPQQLAHGISIALYNTAFGIAIAIPSLIFYRHFKNKVDTFIVEMEQQAAKLVDIVHGERSA